MKRSTWLGIRTSDGTWRRVPLLHQLQRQAEAQIRDEWERMRRVDRERCQHREEAIDEVAVEPLPLVVAQPVGREDCDARLSQLQRGVRASVPAAAP